MCESKLIVDSNFQPIEFDCKKSYNFSFIRNGKQLILLKGFSMQGHINYAELREFTDEFGCSRGYMFIVGHKDIADFIQIDQPELEFFDRQAGS